MATSFRNQIITMFLIALATMAHAQSIYFINSNTGNDSNNGRSESKAWKTLTKINNTQLRPGDKVLFACGSVFYGMLKPQGSGKENMPVVFDKYGKGTLPAIYAMGKFSQALHLFNFPYIEVRNLELSNNTERQSYERRGVFIEAMDFGDVNHIVLDGLYIHDVNGYNKQDGNTGGIRWINGGEKVKTRFTGLIIENCRLLHCDRDGIRGGSHYIERSKWYPSRGVVIRNNYLEDIGGDGIVVIGTDGTLVEHNELNGGRMRAPDYAAGFWAWGSDNTLFQYNEVYGMRGFKDGMGYDADFNSNNTVFQYNYSHDNQGGFMLICTPARKLLPEFGFLDRVTIRYNVSINDGERTFHFAGPSSNVKIYNNFIYVGKELNHPVFLVSDWGAMPTGAEVFNNIFFSQGISKYAFGHSRNEDNGTYNITDGFFGVDMKFRNNVFYGRHILPPADSLAITANPLIAGLDSIYTEDGQVKRGFEFLKGLKLMAGSPCLQRAIALPPGETVEKDLAGKTIVNSRPVNIGVFE